MALDKLFNAVIEGIANVTARILSHPVVQDAVADAIEAGFRKICHSPELHQNIHTAHSLMNAHAAQDAEEIGKDLSKNVGHFIKGVFSHDKKDQSQEGSDKDGSSPGKTQDRSIHTLFKHKAKIAAQPTKSA